MNKSILTLLLTLFFNFTYSQVSNPVEPAKTSVEEYNYMTKGYQIQRASGLDMKNGYTFEDVANVAKGDYYTFNFKNLIKTETNDLVGILVIGYSKVSNRSYYLAMPINNPELQIHFENDVKNWDESMTTAFAQALSQLVTEKLL